MENNYWLRKENGSMGMVNIATEIGRAM